MPSDVEIEISKLLCSSFSGADGEAISSRDLARMWSLEMQWFSPDVAQSLVDRLHDSRWLVGDSDSLSPCITSFQHTPELGWRPFLSRVEEIPEPPSAPPERIAAPPDAPDPPESADRTPSEEETKSKLASMIASMSGLEKREVIRRAQRKRRALGPVSLEMAMLLLAREQNLEMEKLVEMT